jgi:hypothetical protein
MKHLVLSLAACLLLLLATSCRSSRPAATTTTVPSEPRTYTLITLAGEVDGFSFNGQVRMAKDSVIWCNVSKIFDLGRAMATPDSVWLHAPLLGRHDAGDYRMVKRETGIDISFAELQSLLESDDAEQRLVSFARRLGHTATVKIKKRERVQHLTFPFEK